MQALDACDTLYALWVLPLACQLFLHHLKRTWDKMDETLEWMMLMMLWVVVQVEMHGAWQVFRQNALQDSGMIEIGFQVVSESLEER